MPKIKAYEIGIVAWCTEEHFKGFCCFNGRVSVESGTWHKLYSKLTTENQHLVTCFNFKPCLLRLELFPQTFNSVFTKKRTNIFKLKILNMSQFKKVFRQLLRKKSIDAASSRNTELSRCLTTTDLVALGVGSTLGRCR